MDPMCLCHQQWVALGFRVQTTTIVVTVTELSEYYSAYRGPSGRLYWHKMRTMEEGFIQQNCIGDTFIDVFKGDEVVE